MEDKYKNLRLYNGVMGGFHFVQGLLILFLSNDYTLPITTNYLQFNEATQSLQPVTKTIAEVPVGAMIAAFLFLSAIAHFTLTIKPVYDWYIKNLKREINYARWIEYSISSSLMIVIIAMLVGVYDLSTLILMFSLNAMMIFFGMVMEVHNQTTEKTNWLSYFFGCIAGIVPWVVIALFLAGSGSEGAKAPTFVYWIFFSIFIFFNIFAVNMFLQYKKIGKWKDYVFGEKVYILLSLVAKSLLAWQVFAGTLRPV
ncbi:heliorhodopsin HeR [Candidatus Dojkabacteria bacterium]|uniref:Heliorhodopsin HeR n=1 Tax=Candidatus Dojkabacteria bacterium TaxID=2099670 RepID=A0A955L2S1_9BACT|nr:heliorhodopsin HeR [Candidatus Dojkabacteria bacterium]